MEEGSSKTQGRVVCVTGATGFIAGHIVEELLKAGYHVRATVRDRSNTTRTYHLSVLRERYCASSTDRKEEPPSLTLYEADLLKEGSFDSAFDGNLKIPLPNFHNRF